MDDLKRVCVDFDGVLNEYKGYNGPAKLYEPKKGVKEFLKKLSEQYNVVVFTARPLEQVVDWLVKYGLLGFIHKVTDVKEPAMVYLDDRAVRFDNDFDKALDEIGSFKTYWE